jgi:3-oxoadipate enol-lactonase
MLVIAGSESPPGLRSVARILAATLPDARFVELDGSGHVTHLEMPDEFAAAVAAFAAEIQIDTPRAPGRGGPRVVW